MTRLAAVAVAGVAGVAFGACSSPREAPAPEPTRAPRHLVPDAAIPDAYVLPPAPDLDAMAPRTPVPRPLARRARYGDCRPSYAPRPERDPSPMCRVRGGTFQLGGEIPADLAPVVGPTPVPVATTVRDFDIDQFAVTVQQAAVFLNAHGNTCIGMPDGTTNAQFPCITMGEPADDDFEQVDGVFRARAGRELAWAGFNPEGALRYCAWAGKQVASNAQWEYAARHDPRTGKDLRYPWGDTWERDRAACDVPELCSADRPAHILGQYDGTRGMRDGSSPWGLHDVVAAGTELVFACAEPDATCHAGKACTCKLWSSTSQQSNPLGYATYARFDASIAGAGVRCVAPR